MFRWLIIFFLGWWIFRTVRGYFSAGEPRKREREGREVIDLSEEDYEVRDEE